MPSIPALPPAAPSFAQRLNSESDRPQTAPIRVPGKISSRVSPPDGMATIAGNDNADALAEVMTPLAPPLPLVLRPPLRKKKSFSRASAWIFPKKQPNSIGSVDSVTNKPRAIKDGDGFYQSVASTVARGSSESICSSSTWGTGDGVPIAPSNWSADVASIVRQEDLPQLHRIATFGQNDLRLDKSPVVVSAV